MAGTVQQLAIHTQGAVVQPAQQLLVIVPNEGVQLAEVKILNKDIGFVHEGQAVSIKVDAFPYTRYGTIDGELVSVSRDATADEQLGWSLPQGQAEPGRDADRPAARQAHPRHVGGGGDQDRPAPGHRLSAESHSRVSGRGAAGAMTMQQTHAADSAPVANGALTALTHAAHQLMLTADAEQLAHAWGAIWHRPI